MATVKLGKQRVISAAERMIANIDALRAKKDAEFIKHWQRPTIWNFWRGSKSHPDDFADCPTFELRWQYPSSICGRQRVKVKRLAEASTDGYVTLDHKDVDELKLDDEPT